MNKRHFFYKHNLFLLSLLCLPFSGLYGAQLEAMAVPSLMDSDMDAWYKTPNDSVPLIHDTRTITMGQVFTLLVFFKGYSADANNNVHITYDVEVYDPKGKLTEDKAYGVPAFEGPNPKTLILSQGFLKFIFTEKYPVGTYKIKVKAYDNTSKTRTTLEAPIELRAFELPKPFASEKEVSDWMMGYFLNPSPLRAIDGLHQVVQIDSEWINGHPHILTFFGRVFKDNPFLMKNVASRFDAFAEEDQKRLVLIAAVSGDTALDKIVRKNGGELRDFHERVKDISLPSLDGAISKPHQLDMLWSEFLATGKYGPIRKIVSSLALVEHHGTLDKIKSGELDKSKEEVRRKAYLDATYQSAVWSLTSNARQMPLVRQYCRYILEHEALEPEVKQQLAGVLKVVSKKIREDEQGEQPAS